MWNENELIWISERNDSLWNNNFSVLAISNQSMQTGSARMNEKAAAVKMREDANNIERKREAAMYASERMQQQMESVKWIQIDERTEKEALQAWKMLPVRHGRNSPRGNDPQTDRFSSKNTKHALDTVKKTDIWIVLKGNFKVLRNTFIKIKIDRK